MKKLVSLILVGAMLFALAACSQKDEPSGKVTIISSIFPSYDFAREICRGVDGAQVSMLITPGTEPHSYEPSVRDMAAIKDCDLFIYLGGESDEWVDAVLDSFDTDEISTLKMLECVSPLEEEEVEGMQSGHDDEVNASGENDEHVWTSPQNAVLISQAIKDKLCSADSANAQKYTENFERYKAELLQLHNDYKQLFSSKEYTLVVADRFPFRYLAEEYGFKYYAAFPGCSTESDPSAATIAFLEKKVRELDVKAVFYTEFSSQKVADTLCEATGVKKLMLHSCHNVLKKDFESGVTYLSLMKNNLKNLQEALK